MKEELAMEEPVYRTHRSQKYLFKMIRKLLASLIALITIGFFLPQEQSDTMEIFQIVMLVFFSILAIIQFFAILGTRTPLAIFKDKVVIGSLVSVSIPREKIRGIGTHDRTRKKCIVIHSEMEGSKGQLKISWYSIAEDENEVVAALERELGVVD